MARFAAIKGDLKSQRRVYPVVRFFQSRLAIRAGPATGLKPWCSTSLTRCWSPRFPERPRFPSVAQRESSCARRTAGGGCPYIVSFDPW